MWTKEHKEERRLYRKEWYQKNKPRINALQLEYKKARYRLDPEYREKIKTYNKKYLKKNKDYYKKYQKKRYSTDPEYREKVKAWSKAWYRKNHFVAIYSYSLDMNELVEKLKFFMADKDLTIHDVALLIKKDPKTIWQFLHQKVKPHDRTIYKIRKLQGLL